MFSVNSRIALRSHFISRLKVDPPTGGPHPFPCDSRTCTIAAQSVGLLLEARHFQSISTSVESACVRIQNQTP